MIRRPPKPTRTYTLCPYTTPLRPDATRWRLGGAHIVRTRGGLACPQARQDRARPWSEGCYRRKHRAADRPAGSEPPAHSRDRDRRGSDRAHGDHAGSLANRGADPHFSRGGKGTANPIIAADPAPVRLQERSEEHTSELQSLMRISYADYCL